MGVLPSVIILGLLAIAAWRLSRLRISPQDRSSERAAASTALAVATVLQAGHFTEEALHDFHAGFPAVFGLTPMPYLLFLLFNLVCLAAWSASIPGIRKGQRLAFAAAWFLVLAGIVNGIAHPALALLQGSYFAGLYSALPVAIACLWLLRRLQTATRWQN